VADSRPIAGRDAEDKESLMSHDLETIIELQNARDELGSAQAQLDGVPDWMEELHEQHSSHRGVIDELQAAVDEAAKQRRGAEAEVADLREQAKHYQQQISLVTSQREYGALLQEIDTVNSQINELEEKGLALLEQQEEAQKKREEEETAFQELDSRYSAELEKWEAQKPQVAAQAEKLRGRIEVFKERLQPAAVAQFERLFDYYKGKALAPIREIDRGGKFAKMWHCGVCNYRVRPQAVVGIQTRGTIETCDSCKRILYLPEAEE